MSMRRSYIDRIAKPTINHAQANKEDNVVPTAFFHDINFKANHRFNDRHRLIFSGYFGADHYGVNYTDAYKSSQNRYEEETDAYVKWGNYLASLNWNHRLSSRMFANTTLTFSRYRLDNDVNYTHRENNDQQFLNSLYFSGIDDIWLKYAFDYSPDSRHFIITVMIFIHLLYRLYALSYTYTLLTAH